MDMGSIDRKIKKKRKLFSPQEDERLKEIKLKDNGKKTWTSVAEELGTNKNARQCRDRWENYLKPELKNRNWTDEEDLLLMEKYQEYGPLWTRIAKFFNGRSENNVKNRWYTSVAKMFDQYSKGNINIGSFARQNKQVVTKHLTPVRRVNPTIFYTNRVDPSVTNPYNRYVSATPSPSVPIPNDIKKCTLPPIQDLIMPIQAVSVSRIRSMSARPLGFVS